MRKKNTDLARLQQPQAVFNGFVPFVLRQAIEILDHSALD